LGLALNGVNMRVGVGWCNEKEALSSGKKAALRAIENGNIQRPDLVFAFCSGRHDHGVFLDGLRSVVGPEIPVVGGSAVGVITNDFLSYRGCPAGVALIQANETRFRVSAVGDLDKDARAAGRRLVESLGVDEEDKLLLVLYDSIKIPQKSGSPPELNASSPLLEGIGEEGWPVPVIGAGFVGDFQFRRTRQFCGAYVSDQSVVGVMVGGGCTPYYRIMHGCMPLDGLYHTITRMEDDTIYEVDGSPVVEAIDGLYGHKEWREEKPVSLLTIGMNHGKRFERPREGHYVNRLITGVLPGGQGIRIFEPDLETGQEIQFMLRDSLRMLESTNTNCAELLAQIEEEGRKPLFGMYLDCAGRTGEQSNVLFEEALEVQRALNRRDIPLIGFYSGVEIAPLLGRPRGLDWTGVLVVLAGEGS